MNADVQCDIRAQLPIVFDEPAELVLNDSLSIQNEIRITDPRQVLGVFQTEALTNVVQRAGKVDEQVPRGSLVVAGQAGNAVASRALLRQLMEGTWQPRFQTLQAQARWQLEQR